MLRFFFVIGFCAIIGNGFCQAVPYYKSRIVVGDFDFTKVQDTTYAENLRIYIQSLISQMGGFVLAERKLLDKIAETEKENQLLSSEDDYNIGDSKIQVDYLITGEITELRTESQRAAGSTFYKGRVSFTLKLLDLESGRIITTKYFTSHPFSGQLEKSAAINSAIELLKIELYEFFVAYLSPRFSLETGFHEQKKGCIKYLAVNVAADIADLKLSSYSLYRYDHDQKLSDRLTSLKIKKSINDAIILFGVDEKLCGDLAEQLSSIDTGVMDYYVSSP